MKPVHIEAGLRAVLDDRLGELAKRVTVTQTWDDLVLPRDQFDAIVELMARVRQRRTVYEHWGFGAKVGKGLGVDGAVLGAAGHRQDDGRRADRERARARAVSGRSREVVSKYIGETEKNLAALFDAAEAGHAILLFDEADSLFGKRTEVKSSNDRYANLEVNYLLQRLESFTGICLLTTNHETAIDEAFRRRLRCTCGSSCPRCGQRAQLWRAMLPAAAPLAGGSTSDRLAREFAMSGGYIRNAVAARRVPRGRRGRPITRGAPRARRAARVRGAGQDRRCQRSVTASARMARARSQHARRKLRHEAVSDDEAAERCGWGRSRARGAGGGRFARERATPGLLRASQSNADRTATSGTHEQRVHQSRSGVRGCALRLANDLRRVPARRGTAGAPVRAVRAKSVRRWDQISTCMLGAESRQAARTGSRP